MVYNIKNLTRTTLPNVSSNMSANRTSILSMPEMVLNKMIRDGDKSIVHVDMNHCEAVRISRCGINTIYTDGLCGCNSIGIIAHLLDGNILAILSHYVPTNCKGQLEALQEKLAAFNQFLDKTRKAKILMNVGGYKDDFGKLQPSPSTITEKLKELATKFFGKNSDTIITPYPTKNRGAFFSSANIYQFDSQDINNVKVTNVGEQEMYLDLTV